ncbi:MAG: hypothetical protein D6762_06565 [Candidatus Neomarinimicrobiota bacterium]|nr:MAG: hypothetical protein D6762_06565 [Candidatus Neomarinimicrobiota bacterium]
MNPASKRCLVGLTLLSLVSAQVDWFGYLESEWDRLAMNAREYNFGYLKYRLDMESRPTDRVLVAANVNFQQYLGETTWNLLDFLPGPIWKPELQPSTLPDSLWVTEYPFTYHDTLYLDNAYLRVNFNHLDVTLGKQPVSLGTGYAWNPVDIFNYKNPVDPTYEQTGIQALRLDVPLTDRGGLTAILTPAGGWDSATKYIQWKSGIGSFDFTLNWSQYEGVYRWWDYVLYAGLAPTTTRYRAVGGTLVGELFGVGVWTEVWRKTQAAFDKKEFWEAVAGADYTFSNGWYVLNEVYRNEQGALPEAVTLYDYLFYFNGSTHSLMQTYDFFYTFYPVGDFVNAGIFALANLDDHSALVSPQIEWNLYENGTLTLWYSTSLGKADTEFGWQGDGWRLRLRTYF